MSETVLPHDAAVFPGQGWHFVGMGSELWGSPEAQTVYEEACQILHMDIPRLCRAVGDESGKILLEHSQLAMGTVMLAEVDHFAFLHPQARMRASVGVSYGLLPAY